MNLGYFTISTTSAAGMAIPVYLQAVVPQECCPGIQLYCGKEEYADLFEDSYFSPDI